MRNLAIRNSVMGASGPVLPYDAEVEYLESTGTQWIDTLYKPNNYSGFRVICVPTNNQNGLIIGSRDNSGESRWSFAVNVGGHNANAGWNGGLGAQFDVKVYDAIEGLVNYKNNRKAQAFCNSVQMYNLSITKALSPSQHIYSAYLFAWNAYGTAGVNSSARIISAEITEGLEVVMSFIPVRVGQVGYMYDRVSGQLFGNSGTGAFIIGPDKVSQLGGGLNAGV